jgi:hypothetical protein
MSSFLTNIRLNNLERKVDGIIDDIGITNPMVTNLDANNHAINNVSSLSFKDTQNNLNQVLTIKNNELNLNNNPYGNLQNPLGENLDLNHNNIINVNQLKFNDQDVIFSQDGGITFTSTISLGNNDINGVNTAHMSTLNLNNGNLTWNGTNLFINNENIITNENINSYIDTEAEFQKITIGITGAQQYTLGINSTDDLALYTGNSVLNASKVGQIVYNSDENGISTSIINFFDSQDSANHHLKLTDTTPYRLQIDDKNIVIEDDLNNYFNNNEDIHLQHDIYMNGKNIGNLGELGIGLSANKILTIDDDSDLTFDNNKVVTAGNISGFIDGHTGANIWQRVYNESYLTPFNPSSSVIDMPINFNNENQGANPTLLISVFIEGTLNCLIFSRLPNGSNAVVGNSIYKYYILLNGQNTTWSLINDNFEIHNQFTRPDSNEDELSVLTNSTNPNEINLHFDFYSNCQYQIKNTYTVTSNFY